MKIIYKYILVPQELQELKLPIDSKILTVQEQNGNICLWAMFDYDESLIVSRCIECIGTGQTMYDANREYIGTCQIGSIVIHVFERI